jgi:hypothetical protein
VTFQTSIVVWPGVIVVGLAVNATMVGASVGVVALVDVPKQAGLPMQIKSNSKRGTSNFFIASSGIFCDCV